MGAVGSCLTRPATLESLCGRPISSSEVLTAEVTMITKNSLTRLRNSGVVTHYKDRKNCRNVFDGFDL